MTIVPRIRLISIAAASIALAGSLAPAQAAPPASRTGANVQGQNQSADQNRRICADVELTGTRMTRRVCRTAAEWERTGGLPAKN